MSIINNDQAKLHKATGMSSKVISKNLKKFNLLGHKLNDQSKNTDKALENVMKNNLIPYAKTLFENVKHDKAISLYECQKRFDLVTPSEPNKKVSMKPDGGILFSGDLPILVSEMKVQGTNDRRFFNKLRRQATGNAVERAAKNVRGAEMFFDYLPVFPYVIFASGCDFHPTETIASRLEMMNYGIPNKTIVITPETTDDSIEAELKELIDSIDITKKRNKSIATVFCKSHKWDCMDNGSSLWTEEEIFKVLKSVLDKVYTVFQQPSLNADPDFETL